MTGSSDQARPQTGAKSTVNLDQWKFCLTLSFDFGESFDKAVFTSY
jgi:hypothetical protein